MSMSEYSLSDLAAVTRDNDGFGGMGGGWLAWILLFALFGGGIGGVNGWGNRCGYNDGRCATVEDLASGFNFSGVNNKLNEIVAGQANINQNLGNAICQLGYQGAQHTYELGSKIDQCCCQTQLGIQGVKFDMANYASGIQMSQMQGTQKVLDKLCAMESAQKDAVIAQQGQRIAALEADARMCGIPRINPYGYGIYAYQTCQPCANGAFAY